jgi:RimJ/RimL family protein N-acetyltransferase
MAISSLGFWPLAGLRITTPRLELRWPGESDLLALAELAAGGVHDPAAQPFTVAWTDVEPAERARSVLQYHWGRRAAWAPADWALELVVVRDGTVVGTQGISASGFAIRREVSSGSWLGLPHHRQGIGTQMRAAILHLAFAGLGAEHAVSSAAEDNAASLGVSRRLGYRDDGAEIHAIRNAPVVFRRLRLDRASWQAARSVPVQITGLEPCLPGFGIAAPGSSPGAGGLPESCS